MTPRQERIRAIVTTVSMCFFAVLILFSFLSTEDVLFDRMTGWVFATVNVRNETIVECSTDIPAGQSLFSAYCIGPYENPEIMQSVPGFLYLFHYDSTNALDPWKAYNPSLPDWVVHDLTLVSRFRGYVIGMALQGTFSFEGIQKNQEEVPVYTGYNLIPFPLNEAQGINASLSSVYGQYSHVVGYDSVAGEYLNFTPGEDNNTLHYLEPFQGYWINMSDAGYILFTK